MNKKIIGKIKKIALITGTVLAFIIFTPQIAKATGAGFNIPINPTSQSETEATEQGTDSGEIDFTHPSDFTLSDDMTIAEGVYVESINIGGMSPSQAREAIEGYYSSVVNSVLGLEASANTIYKTTLKELGYSYNIDGIIEEAAFLGQAGLLTSRYKTIQDLKYDKVVIPVSFEIDEEKATAYVEETIAVNDTPSQNASITRKDGSFVITPSVTGVATDVEATVENIVNAINDGVKIGMIVEVAWKENEPEITGEMLSEIKDKLGTYSTIYESSADGRKNNIQVACSNINGTILLPGQSFSTSDTMKERNVENGYQIAGEYVDGATVEAVGGGVCQVATTLYQAALQAELQIDKRYNHSMLVSYVEPSFDAAISWGNKDLVFTNNTDSVIYIEAIADGSVLCFNIYGKEYRASNRTIVYENVIIERIKSESITKEDPNQPVGYTEKKGSNHDACKSYLIKKVYIDGVLTETVKFKEDTYQASYETITVGTNTTIVPTETDPAAETEPATTEPVTEADPATEADPNEGQGAESGSGQNTQ